MPLSAASPDTTLPRVWCVAASHAPIVAVLARCYGEPRWTCVLRRNWQSQTVEEGAWTTMHIRAHRCTLSPDGEFLLCHAEGSSDGPFSGFFGGAFAVSRLPWLSALTHPDTFGPAGAAVSRDALDDKDQARVLARFETWPKYVRDEHWPRHLGPGWTALPLEQAARFGIESGSRGHLAAISELGGTSMALLAVVDAGRNTHDDPLWSVWHDSLRHFLVSPSRRSVTALPGVRWLHAAKADHVLLADDRAGLKVVRFTEKSDPDQSPQVVFEHSLTSLTPTPRAAPPWTKAPPAPAR